MVRTEREVPVAEQPGGLGGAEVRIEHQARRGAHEGQVPRLDELGAERRGAAVLPDDGVVERPPAGAVEGHQRLSLVGDADGRHGLAGLGEACPHLGQRGPHGVPDLGRVVLDPARPWEVLGQLPVGDVGDPGPLVDDQGTHAGRARIDGDDLGHGEPTLTVRGYPASGWGAGRAPRQTIANAP